MHPRAVTRIASQAAAVLLLLSGCDAGAPVTQPPVSPSGLATVEVGTSEAPAGLGLDGVVEAVDRATLSAQTSGRVSEVPVDVDDAVKQGQVLLRLSATEQVSVLREAQAALAAATSREAQARAQHDRIRDMYERKVVARATYYEALAMRDGARAALAAATARVAAAREGVGYTEVRAPFDGVVTDKRVQPGETVTPGTPLLSVASLAATRVIADVPQSVAPALRTDPRATVRAGDVEFEASSVTLYPSAQPQSGTVRARIDLPAGAPTLAPGTFAKVVIHGGDDRRLLVPRSAVVERSELRAVYVVRADQRVSFRQVRLGRPVGDRVEVIAGLARGERIATDPSAAALAARAAATNSEHD
ncbi:MAG TPA: efflux RND transporter periplasmic adaptor subunit [Steroidobacteraceae bacterium]|nr:efflux RND transporter periplasmic adaptor subunit [Steroidobacteraceae bacterium]